MRQLQLLNEEVDLRMIPALLMRTCTVPKALTAASITFWPSATDPGAAAAFPPARKERQSEKHDWLQVMQDEPFLISSTTD